MSAPIINQPWEDVADDVTGAIEKAVQPLLKKAVDDIYSGLLDATQDYLKDNLAFNIASRIDCAEREASTARQRCAELTAAIEDIATSYLGDQPASHPGTTRIRPSVGEALIERDAALWHDAKPPRQPRTGQAIEGQHLVIGAASGHRIQRVR